MAATPYVQQEWWQAAATAAWAASLVAGGERGGV